MRIFSLFLFAFLFSTVGSAQTNMTFWQDANEAQMRLSQEKKVDLPTKSRLVSFDLERLKKHLQNAPLEFTNQNPISVTFPMPDGKSTTFQLEYSPVMAPKLAAKYPQIKSFKGLSDEGHVIRCGFGGKGFHAVISRKGKKAYIDNLTKGDSEYHMSYWKSDFRRMDVDGNLGCGYVPDPYEGAMEDLESHYQSESTVAMRGTGDPVEMRVYRLAMAGTAEYTNYHGGTVDLALAAMVLKVNRLNTVFEKDFATRMVLIDNNDEIIYTNATTDPYTNGDTGAMNGQNVSNLNARIGSNNFDIGHVLGTNSALSGLASLGGVCGGSKASASSTIPRPEGDDFVIDIIAHEMGHQYAANHSMSSCHNVASGTAYEVGGGVTIMSYSGICGLQNNIAQHSFDYYNAGSVQEIKGFLHFGGGNNCGERIQLNSTEPEVEIPLVDGFYIPISTPFKLTAIATDDEDQDRLTYNWEQFDLGPMSVPGAPMGNCPLFRNYYPSDSPTRIFPKIENVLAGDFFDREEFLPNYKRDLTFRCMVRDNHPDGGATVWDEVSFKVDSVRPFRVEYPADRTIVEEGGKQIEVKWDVAGTFDGPVQCKRVNIDLSLNGGFTFPISLAQNTINDGSEMIFLPDTLSSRARIRVEAADNIFFSISAEDFRLTRATEPGYSLSLNPQYQKVCLPANIDMDIITESFLGYSEDINLELIGNLPTGVNSNFTKNPVAPGEISTLNFELDNMAGSSLISFDLIAYPDGGDTITRSITFDLARNDFSALETLTPFSGIAGIDELPEYSWHGAPDAEFYDFQLATSPAFDVNDIVYAVYGTRDTFYNPVDLLVENTPYYWRVRPVNQCGNGEYLTASAFHTVSKTCLQKVVLEGDAQRLPIPGNGLPVVASTVPVLETGMVNDLNIPNIKGSYETLKSIRISLVSPDSTRAILFEKRCNGSVFNFGFDDASNNLNPCPANNGVVRRSQEELQIFNGKPLVGVWKLEVDVVTPGSGGGGSIEEWTFEYCADLALTPPNLLRNDTLTVLFGTGGNVNKDFLEVEDDNDGPGDLTYTIVSLPTAGMMLRNSLPMEVGDQFTQSDINRKVIWYENDGQSQADFDNFTFTIRDSEGGWVATPQFNFKITNVVSADDINKDLGRKISMFPNPADEVVNVQLDRALIKDLSVNIFNAQGKLMRTAIIANSSNFITIETDHLPEGFYFVSFNTDEGRATKRLVISR